MGKLGPRLDSRKNAKRWPKGQSSSSNPQTTKYREQATSMFFKELTGTPGITKEDLQKHDAIQGIQPQLENLNIDTEEVESTIDDGTFNTFDTFASNYSNCSNVSFTRFLSHFQSDSLLHKEMLAVLSAVTEVIKQNGGNESSTEYFAALMSTLEAVETETSIAATLSLLGMGLRTVPKNVLNMQFGMASQIFMQVLTRYAGSEEFLILRHCIGCLSVMLRAQETAAWSNTSTMQVFNVILSFATHSKPRVRKAAQHGICAILKGSDIMKIENPPPYHPAASAVAKHCEAQLEAACEPGGITSILHTLTLLKDIMHQLPKSHVKAICEGLLRIMSLKNVLITSCCLQVLHGLFVSRPSETILPAERNAQIITALYDYQPPVSDVQPTLAWLAVMQEAYCNLVQHNLTLGAAITPRILETCINLWLSDKSDIISGTSHTLKTLLQDCISPLCETEDQARKYNNTLTQLTGMMHRVLSYQYIEAWYHILHLIALLFQIMGKTKIPGLLDILKSLAELRDSYNFTYKSNAEYAIGAAIRTIGPDVVLHTLAFRLPDGTLNLNRTWILPLLKDCITHGSISFFMETLLPIVDICSQKSKEPVGGKTYTFLIPQIWAILPSICSNASDVAENFKNIAMTLGEGISQHTELRLSIMSALRRLITKAIENKNETDKAVLARYAKNYLPILFNFYTTAPTGTEEQGQCSAAFDTITVYLKITSEELANELFDRALNKLKEPETTKHFKESVYNLITILIEHTEPSRLKMMYDMSIPFLKDKSQQKEQKKTYRFLEQITSSEREVCKNFVSENRRDLQKLLISATPTLVRTSKGARLKCLIHLAKIHPQLENTKFLQAIVPEAVSCIKEMNKKTRNAAYQLINAIAEKFLANTEHFKNYVQMLMAGLNDPQGNCSSTLLVLASVTYNYNGSLGVETTKEILRHACVFTLSPTREVVESALSYIKVYITVMPSPLVASSLNNIIPVFSQMNEDCKRHFRQKVRDILIKFVRKYGVGVISGMIPSSDAVLHKRLKNIHKVDEIKKKHKMLRKMKQLENDNHDEFDAKRRPKTMEEILADSEDDFEDTNDKDPENKTKRQSRKEAWIQENEESIVDLIDPAAARNITTTQPGVSHPTVITKKTKDRGFKTAPDGRIIIADDIDDDSDTDKAKKKKKKLLLHSDSEDDYEDDDDDLKSMATSKSVNLKRKHTGSVDGISLASQSTKYQAGGTGIHRAFKFIKTNQLPGAEYRAPKARGDVKKKGKPDPYAYLPLAKTARSKRKKNKNAAKLKKMICGKSSDNRYTSFLQRLRR